MAVTAKLHLGLARDHYSGKWTVGRIVE